MRLYCASGMGSVAVEAVLLELGIAYEKRIIDVKGGEQRSPEYLAINPRGQVPALRLDDGSVLTESAAIAYYLAEAHGKGRLLPPLGSPRRGQVLRWLFFAAANLYETDLRYYYAERYTSDPGGVEGVRRSAAEQFERCSDIIEREIAEGPFLLGAELSVADPYIAMLAEWHWTPEAFFAKRPKLAGLRKAVASRPALAKLWAENF